MCGWDACPPQFPAQRSVPWIHMSTKSRRQHLTVGNVSVSFKARGGSPRPETLGNQSDSIGYFEGLLLWVDVCQEHPLSPFCRPQAPRDQQPDSACLLASSPHLLGPVLLTLAEEGLYLAVSALFPAGSAWQCDRITTCLSAPCLSETGTTHQHA